MTVDLEQGKGKWIWNRENGLGTGKVDLEQEKWIWNWEDRSFGTGKMDLEQGRYIWNIFGNTGK